MCLAGCIPSLNGLYSEKTATFSDQLLGAWKGPGNNVHFLFTADATRPFYKLIYVEDKSPPVVFRAALARLGGALYLDIVPLAPEPAAQNSYFGLHVTLWHSFAKIDISAKQLHLRLADPAWLEKQLAANPGALPHFSSQGIQYLTADTASLQAFVTTHDALFEAKPTLFARE
jgi:hypothetical protein